MKKIVILSIFFLSIQVSFTQEWKSLKSYQRVTGDSVLPKGFWLKKDRKRDTEIWKEANKYNLSIDNGNQKYKTIKQIRDFYRWFDIEREKSGHEIKIIGIAAIVAGQLSNLDNYFIRTFIIRNKEVVWFANEGSKQVLKYAFPLLKEVYFSNEILKGQKAENWDRQYIKTEQCQIVESVYKQLSSKAMHKLERLAKGKGIYSVKVTNKLKFEGDIRDCKTRYEHVFSKLNTYYLDNK